MRLKTSGLLSKKTKLLMGLVCWLCMYPSLRDTRVTDSQTLYMCIYIKNV